MSVYQSLGKFLAWVPTIMSACLVVMGVFWAAAHAMMGTLDLIIGDTHAAIFQMMSLTNAPQIDFTCISPAQPLLSGLVGCINYYFHLQSIINFLYTVAHVECLYFSSRATVMLYKMIPLNG